MNTSVILYSIIFSLLVALHPLVAENKNKTSSNNPPSPAELFVSKTSLVHVKAAQLLNNKGVTAMQLKHYEQAEGFFLEARDKDPNNASATYNLATVYLITERPQKAQTLLINAIKNFPSDAHLLSRLGDVYFTKKSLAAAEFEYAKAYNLDPTMTHTALRLATTQILLNKQKEAQTTLDGLSNKHSTEAKVLGAIAALYLASGELTKGIDAAKNSIKLVPTKEAYISLGSAYELSGDMASALTAFINAAAFSDAPEELRIKIKSLRQRLNH